MTPEESEKFSSLVDGGQTWIDDDVVSRTGMPHSRWQYLKALKPRDTLMFKSCQPNKVKGTRATYRKAEHGARN